MKCLLAPAALMSFVTVTAAFAADLPARVAPPVFVAPPAAPSWNGFYIGVNAGGTVASGSSGFGATPLFNAGIAGAGPFQAAVDQTSTGSGGRSSGVAFIGGGQIGYNRQLSPMFVAGLEADIQGLAGSSGARSVTNTAPIAGFANAVTATTTVSNRIDYFGTARGRIGILATPEVLLYATGGLAYGGVRSSLQYSELLTGANFVFPNPAFANAGGSQIRVGYTVGAGFEWKFSPNWSLKAEYLYYDLGTTTRNATLTTGAAAAVPFTIDQITLRTRMTGNIARLGLNYSFSSTPAPVVARY